MQQLVRYVFMTDCLSLFWLSTSCMDNGGASATSENEGKILKDRHIGSTMIIKAYTRVGMIPTNSAF
jgi:hypothetical protein